MKSVSNSIWSIAAMLGIAFIMSIISCQNEKSLYYIKLNDSIEHAIRSYASENNINLKSRVITTDWIVNPYRTDVYISNTFQQFLNKPDHVPTYYSIVSDSIIVLVYTGIESEMVRNTQAIQKEMGNLLNQSDTELQPDKETTTHVKTWLFSSCEGNSAILVREPSMKDLLYVHCRDSNN
jgi:hypothetical protein